MITIAYINKAGDTIKITNDVTFKEVTVMFDTPKQTDEMVLNLLEKNLQRRRRISNYKHFMI